MTPASCHEARRHPGVGVGMLVAGLAWGLYELALVPAERGMAPIGFDHGWAIATYAFLGSCAALRTTRFFAPAKGGGRNSVLPSFVILMFFVAARTIVVIVTTESSPSLVVFTSVYFGTIFVLPAALVVLAVRQRVL